MADALRAQDADVTAVEWRPPGGGDPDVVADLVATYGDDRVDAANAAALAALQEARPMIVGAGPAGDLIPGLEGLTVLHAGPPVEWGLMCEPQRNADGQPPAPTAETLTLQASSQATLIGMPRSSIVDSSSVLDRSTTTLGGVRSSATGPSATIAVTGAAVACVLDGRAAIGPTAVAAPLARFTRNSSGLAWPARRRAA